MNSLIQTKKVNKYEYMAFKHLELKNFQEMPIDETNASMDRS